QQQVGDAWFREFVVIDDSPAPAGLQHGHRAVEARKRRAHACRAGRRTAARAPATRCGSIAARAETIAKAGKVATASACASRSTVASRTSAMPKGTTAPRQMGRFAQVMPAPSL